MLNPKIISRLLECNLLGNRSKTETYSLAELKDMIRHEISCIHLDMVHASVNGVLTRLQNVQPCGDGHVASLML